MVATRSGRQRAIREEFRQHHPVSSHISPHGPSLRVAGQLGLPSPRCLPSRRALLIREVDHQVREGVMHESTTGDAPEGFTWEVNRLNVLHQAAEDYYDEALSARRG